ncbi:twin-arginine translocase subunit TatC [Actinoallomurus sp. CA-150999]|uniref:twin-arginine translocase subunit TatC n=1 Tax=Actinoallomurus sp. CA-150999 TaxID=3239887 RepID=UPI003D940380
MTTKPSRSANPDGRMPLMEHIRELRSRLLKAMLAILVGTGIGLWQFDRVWSFLQQPYCQLPQQNRLGKGCGLVVNGLTEGFFLNLKIALIVGVVLASPIWLYQLWAFVAPGLYQRERRWTYIFLTASVPLFVGGAFLAYVTLDKGLGILLSFVPHGTTALVTVTSYLGYAVAMLLIFGVTFELPLFVVILNLAGVLTHARIKKSRRLIIFGLFVFAAVATPSQDPFTMLALALPTVVLFEVAEVIAYIHDRRKAARPDPYADLSDDEASPLDLPDGEIEDGERV